MTFTKYPKINSIFKRDENTKKFMMGVHSEFETEYLKDNIWNWYYKADGTNIRIKFDGEKVVFGGRTENSIIPKKLLEYLQEKFTVDMLNEVFTDVGENSEVVIYGEGVGKGIQKAGKHYDSENQKIIIFDIKVGHWWLKHTDMAKTATMLNMQYCPKIDCGTIDEAIDFVKRGFQSPFNKALKAEGLVLRPMNDLKNRAGHRIMTKIKSVDFK